MRRKVNLKNGLNLNLAGAIPAADEPWQTTSPSRVAIVPDDFHGLRPKPEVAEGDHVVAGQPVIHDKTDPDIKLVSPVEGVVEAISRGPRRKIERIVITTGSKPDSHISHEIPTDAPGVRRLLKLSGLWAAMRQRPYDIVPLPYSVPRDIFVTAMDTAPLAADMETLLKDRQTEIEAGIKALAMLTTGHIYIGVRTGSSLPDYVGAEMVEFTPLHPAGNAGIQAANIKPVNKGETIWTLDAVTLAKIGGLMLAGHTDFTVDVAVTGSEITAPCMLRTIAGADIRDLLDGRIADDGRHHRIISGNVLTGTPESLDGFLRFPYRQITVIPEGDDADEFMGWASVSPSKMSVSPSFPGHFFGRKFNPDARLQGGKRAMIMSGVYDRYIPMDIMPEYLIKAIISKDIDQMEALGIYEVAPEDFALAEYADPSKLELQRIVRDGLDYLRSEV